jgi:hypothetical protein
MPTMIGPSGDRQPFPVGRATLDEARALLPELGLAPFGNLVQMVPDGGGVGRGGDRQNILQKIDGHTVENEGSPLGFEIEQFGGGVFSQEPGQRPERLGLRRAAPAAVKARPRKRHLAEGGRKTTRP